MPAQTAIPRWRGFNLPSKTLARDEEDFRLIAELGFDFVRIPMSYHQWTDLGDRFRILEEKVEGIDATLRLGEKYGIHINLNFHRGPGYCCMPGPDPDGGEPWSLWTSDEALRAFCLHWAYFARRYRGIPSSRLSFNLLNESPPPSDALPRPQTLPLQAATRAQHERVVRAAVAAIRAEDPERLIFVDGMWYGRWYPSFELADLGVVQSTRSYMPMGLSHYQAPWWREGGMHFPEPTWPGAMEADHSSWTRATLEDLYGKWAELASLGVGVHCGEGGCYSKTPHAVFLRWYEDVLDILTTHNIGWALWNFRGHFGLLDSERVDVAYEDWKGHRLDRKLLDLLRRF